MLTIFRVPAARHIALAATIVLASCGGGGGGGGAGTVGVTPSTPSAPQASAVVITETNAKPVAANAFASTQNTSATRGATSFPSGVQVGTGAAPDLQAIAQAAQVAMSAFGGAQVPAGVVYNPPPTSCALGGTISMSGNVANVNSLSPGDTVTVTMNGCGMTSASTNMVLNGQMTMTFVSGTFGTPPFHVVLAMTMNNMSVQSGNTTAVINGDTRLDWNASTASSQTLTASGASLTTRTTVGSVTQTTTMSNYVQTFGVNSGSETASLSATVQTDSPRLSSSPVTYTITTVTPVSWNTASGTPVAGAVKVVGANNSALLATINLDGTVTIQLDANGDGAYEKTINSTTTELAGLL